MFESASLTALSAISYDHCPLILKLKSEQRSQKLSKYENFWDDTEGCSDTIKKGWGSQDCNGEEWEDLSKRINNCKKELMSWSKTQFPLFVSVLSSLQPRFLHQPSSIAAVSRAARRAAQRAARLCSLNTAAHHLLTLLYTMSTSRQALDSNVPTPASAGSTVGAAPVGPAPAAPIRSNRVTQAGNILVQ
ncbi:hypothetical protein AHAS_Ahas05G0001500 [Arachis hypogaea]